MVASRGECGSTIGGSITMAGSSGGTWKSENIRGATKCRTNKGRRTKSKLKSESTQGDLSNNFKSN